MNYAETIKFLYSLRLFGLKLGLEHTRSLAALAGNPQDQLRFIHIAGTNGKGSVAAMLESIYRESGLRVGLFTSPHLVSLRERIQVNRQLIRESDVVRWAATLQDLNPGDVTFFEFVTVLALGYFAEQRCDLVIWETGLGGRLDATNIVTPLASVITNVEPDHQRWLGHDLKSIATEKAGIIKPGIPALTATSAPEALTVIEETAQLRDSALTLVTPESASHPPLDEVQLPLLGWHQRMNAATALATVQILQARFPVAETAIRSGLETVDWPGRLQLVKTAAGRRILLDGAHNAAAATSLRAVLQENFADTPITLILGILEDKDWELMCEVLAPVAERILCVPVNSERGAAPDKLAGACRSANRAAHITTEDSVALALERAVGPALTVVAGSIYLVGDVLNQLAPNHHPATDEQALNEWERPAGT